LQRAERRKQRGKLAVGNWQLGKQRAEQRAESGKQRAEGIVGSRQLGKIEKRQKQKNKPRNIR
jgi:hypothetical protein